MPQNSNKFICTYENNDEHYTPKYAVLPIIKYLMKDKIIWCPFDTKNSEFVLNLGENGFEVVYSHIVSGQDFYIYEPTKWDIIVSNPPFAKKRKIFERALSFNKPFALLVSNTWLNDVAPKQLFKSDQLQLLMFDKRINYNGKSNAPFSSSYFCKDILPSQIIIENLDIVKGQKSRMHQDFENS